MTKFAFAFAIWVVALTTSVADAGWFKSRFPRFAFCQPHGCNTPKVQTTHAYHPGMSGPCNSCSDYAVQAYQPPAFHPRPVAYHRPTTSVNGHTVPSCPSGTGPAQ